MAKENLTNFQCDQCKKTIMIRENDGFPYNKGWCYLYNFNAQISKDKSHRVIKDLERIDKKDCHFCCKSCLLDFVKDSVDYASTLRIKQDVEETPSPREQSTQQQIHQEQLTQRILKRQQIPTPVQNEEVVVSQMSSFEGSQQNPIKQQRVEDRIQEAPSIEKPKRGMFGFGRK